jgi:DNA-binding transcriptional regulator YiaG
MMSADYDTSQKAGVRNTVKIQTEEMEKYVSVKCVTADEVWNKKCDGLEEYVRTEKKLPPRSEKLYGVWLHTQRLRIDKMKAYRRERLMKIPEFSKWYNTPKKAIVVRSWEDMCTGVEKYVMDEDRLPPQSDKIYGSWVSCQKNVINTMLQTRRERLMQIDLFSKWFTNSQKKIKRPWDDMCTELEEYVHREKKFPVKADKIYLTWLNTQKANIITMSEDKRERLLKIPLFNAWFIESQKKEKKDIRKWDDVIIGLEEYIQREKKLPHQSDKIYGHWISTQKANIDSIPPKRRERLLKIKEFNEWYIEFNSKERTIPRPWDDMYAELVDFVQKEKRLPLSTCKKNSKDKRLVRWINHQKQIIDKISADRRERMMEIPDFKKWYDNRAKT